MTPETEALIARVRELNEMARNGEAVSYRLADLAPQLADALEAMEARADAAEKHIQLTGGYHERTAREVEVANALADFPQCDWESADHALNDLLEIIDAGRNRLFTAESRADAAEAKLKVAQIALERIDERSAHPTTGTSELWAIAANALEALTQLEP